MVADLKLNGDSRKFELAALERREGERSETSRSGGAANSRRAAAPPAPDPEVVAKAQRRKFTAEYKLGIVEEAPVVLQFGETQWWYFPNTSQDPNGGMGFYDQEAIDAFDAATGHQIWPFTTNADDPVAIRETRMRSPTSYATAYGRYCADVMTHVRSHHPTAVFECLWPLDANQGKPAPDAAFRRLLMHVNLPNEWKTSSYGIKYFRCEGFDYDVWQKNSVGSARPSRTRTRSWVGPPRSAFTWRGSTVLRTRPWRRRTGCGAPRSLLDVLLGVRSVLPEQQTDPARSMDSSTGHSGRVSQASHGARAGGHRRGAGSLNRIG